MDNLTDVEAIFQIAFGIESSEIRNRYLQQVCDGNPALQDRVLALLRVHEEEPEFLEPQPTAVAATMDVAIAERPGTEIGPYKLLQEIGEGGMGVVYMAHQREPVRRRVALKIVQPGMDSREVISRFKAEEQALAMMDQPNMPKHA